MTTRHRHSWRVTQITPNDMLPTVPYGSERAAYDALERAREHNVREARDGVSAKVEHWENGRWALYERVDLTPPAAKRVEETPC